MTNLLTFQYMFNIYFIFWCEKGEDPDPDLKLIISDPDP